MSILGLINMLYSRYSNQLLKETIKGIVQFQEEQIKQWESLSIDITALKQGPIFSAKIFLNDATKEHRNDKECRELIDKAKEKFIDALGILEAKTEKSFWDFHQIGMVQYFISLCWLLLLQNEDATDWLQLSLETINLNQNHIKKKIHDDQAILKQAILNLDEAKKTEPIRKKMSIGIGVAGILTISPIKAFMAISALKSDIPKLQSNIEEMEKELSKTQEINAQGAVFYQYLLETKEILSIGKEENL